MSNLNSNGLEIWESTHIDTGDGRELRAELREIRDAHPERCECSTYSFRQTVGLHMLTKAFAAHAPDLTPAQLETLRVLFSE